MPILAKAVHDNLAVKGTFCHAYLHSTQPVNTPFTLESVGLMQHSRTNFCTWKAYPLALWLQTRVLCINANKQGSQFTAYAHYHVMRLVGQPRTVIICATVRRPYMQSASVRCTPEYKPVTGCLRKDKAQNGHV